MLTIPDRGEGANDIQSILFQEILEVLVAGVDGRDCVLAGGAVTAQGSPDMTVAVAKASILSNGVLKPVSAGNVTITTAHATLPRLDLIVADSTGAKQCRAGTAAAAPKPPARTANDVVLAIVYVPGADTAIATNQITDLRLMRTQGPITVYKTATPVTFNNTSTIQTYASLVLPSGLLLTGKVLRLRCGGTYLLNSGTPTITLTIAYGGTTMFADVSAVSLADADRGAWALEVELTAQGTSDQSLIYRLLLDKYSSARAAPTTGVAGDLAVLNNISVGVGSSAVDSDAADRTLTVQWTMNVANAANEIVMESASATLE